MYQNYKVKIFIFAGRQQTMELLMPQLKSDYIDEIIIAKNTNNQNDLRYLDSLKDNFEKIKYIEIPNEIKRDNHKAWKYLYRFMQDEDSIYFKMDDDVIYIKPDYFEKTLKFRCEHPEYLCIFPVIVNNPFICTRLKVHPLMFAKMNNFDLMRSYFYSGKYGAGLHDLFLMEPEADYWKIDNYEIDQKDVYLKPGSSITQCNTSRIVSGWDYAERICINSICFFGKDFKELDVCQKINKSYSDELFLTYNIFNFTNRKHCILGDTLICHFAFSGQQGLRERNDILNQYRNLIDEHYK